MLQQASEGHRSKSRTDESVWKSVSFHWNLSFLQALDLSENSLDGSIPPEIGRLTRLKNLNLSFNSLAGGIPGNLSGCYNLVNVSLDHNFMKQQIPWEIGTLLKLERLYPSNNNLTGKFPASIGNLSSLQEINLSYNDMEGEIPGTIGSLTKLTLLRLGLNQFSGVFPPAIYNLSSLKYLSLTENHFHGNLRMDIGIVFPNIQHLSLSTNNFTGQIPVSLSNASSLLSIELSSNHFTGNIPPTLGYLQNLNFLNIGYNLLGNHTDNDLLFLSSLANCTSLQVLDISMNQFGGKLSSSIANLSSQLNWLNVYGNSISRSIPEEIVGLVGLTTLILAKNLFTGNIPTSIGTLPKLKCLYLAENRLTGEIPSSLGNLDKPLKLFVFNNSLEGSLPSPFSNLKRLLDARFCHNKFNVTIPPDIINLSSLLSITLNLSHNSFTGPLPAEVGNLKFLAALDVSHNYLSGSIPDLSRLKDLQYLDLSRNNLSGVVPKYLADFPSLMNLNLSCNDFEGEVPAAGVFKNESAIQVYGNSKLCGWIPQLHLQPCPEKEIGRPKILDNLKLILPPVIVCSCILLFFSMFLLCRKSLSREANIPKSSFGHVYPRISFKELHDATEGFSSKNLIGAGSFGALYVGTSGPGEVPIAVKVLKIHQPGASKNFMAECKALTNIRHRNLVKLVTVCSGTDYKGKDFKAFVYPYMSNGSLETWLHPEDDLCSDRNLNLLQRINIAIDIASALQYLHHQCQFLVIHCDLKPSNVLLDDDLTALVSDFGLAKLLSRFRGEAYPSQSSSLGIKGTIGYIAPEYGTGNPVSTLGDVYSYGILLLELFTGRRPVNETFKDNINLHNFVKLALLDEVLTIINQSALHEEERKDVFLRDMNKEVMIDCLVSVLQIGIACSAENPQDRINMMQVVDRLVSIKEIFLDLMKKIDISPESRFNHMFANDSYPFTPRPHQLAHLHCRNMESDEQNECDERPGII
ncbi:putative receptor-like protein kinase [Sesamum angolense]|uniref:non-specific serine/threonine protein kinase n=1 Tax=Sesamum angolense TaxID=2727404 RepID=A0AAE1WI23_9LAMI|nr:putative receptor-like protein kinase [Sesamum angolense]